MAKRAGTKSNNDSDSGVSKLPGGMKFKAEKGGDIESIEKKFKASSVGEFLRIGKDEEYVVAILDIPENWSRMPEHAISGGKGGWIYLPCTTNCPACTRVPDSPPRLYACIPVYVYELKKVQYFRAPGTVMTEMITKYKRNKERFLTNQWVLARYDSDGPTRYEFDRQDAKVSSKVKKEKAPDFEKALIGRWKRGIESLQWKVTGEKFEDEDEDDKVFDHADDDSDDIDLEDIKKMNQKQLVELIEEYELDIDEPEGYTIKGLRIAVTKQMESLDEDDDEDDEED